MHYYFKKYPHLHYDYKDTDGIWTMFSVRPNLFIYPFKEYYGRAPKTFFDCGAATGYVVYRAERDGMIASGIDIKKYPYQNEKLEKLFKEGKIQIKSILDCELIKADIAYCNGVLTYFNEQELQKVLEKFKECGMLAAIHNTSEDISAAEKQGDILMTCNEPRLIKPMDWWFKTFSDNGFTTKYDATTRCFLSFPKTR